MSFLCYKRGKFNQNLAKLKGSTLINIYMGPVDVWRKKLSSTHTPHCAVKVRFSRMGGCSAAESDNCKNQSYRDTEYNIAIPWTLALAPKLEPVQWKHQNSITTQARVTKKDLPFLKVTSGERTVVMSYECIYGDCWCTISTFELWSKYVYLCLYIPTPIIIENFCSIIIQASRLFAITLVSVCQWYVALLSVCQLHCSVPQSHNKKCKW